MTHNSGTPADLHAGIKRGKVIACGYRVSTDYDTAATTFRRSVRADQRDATLALLVTEYQQVSQVIPLYRQLDNFVLAGTGLVVSAAIAAFAALMSAEHQDATKASLIFAAAAWGPALLLVVHITAVTRVLRASQYIAKHLQPIAHELTGRADVLKFDEDPSAALINDFTAGGARPFFLTAVRLCAGSAAIQLIPVMATIGLACGALMVQPSTVASLLSCLAVLWAAAAAAYELRCYHLNQQSMTLRGRLPHPVMTDDPSDTRNKPT